MGDVESEVHQAVRSEMQLITRHMQETRGAFTGRTHDDWLQDALNWYAQREV